MSGAASSTVARIYPVPLPPPLPPVPNLARALLPQCIRSWLADCADALQVPLEYTAVPAIIAMGGIIGRRVGVQLKQQNPWIEYPVLWGALIGRPSAGKSPAICPARRMLDLLESEARVEFEAASKAHARAAQIDKIEEELATKAVRKLMSGGDRDGAEAILAALEEDGHQSPLEPRIVVNDSTVEKLSEILSANPRGVIYVRDEISSWLATLDRDGRESDRGFFLECWNAKGSYTVDRIGRGTTRIEACAVSIMGGIQPGRLAEYVRGAVKGGAADDGLLQRFQLSVYPDISTSWQFRDVAPDPTNERDALSLFRYLHALDPVQLHAETDDYCETPFLRLCDAAQERFAEWLTSLMQRIRSGAEPPHMESHLSKYSALAGRLALVLHLADRCSGPVSDAAMAMAIEWCGFLEAHARRIYAPITDNGISTAHLLLKRRADLEDGFTARMVYRRGWTGLTDKALLEAGLELLVDHGYLRSWIEGTTELGGRPSVHYAWLAH